MIRVQTALRIPTQQLRKTVFRYNVFYTEHCLKRVALIATLSFQAKLYRCFKHSLYFFQKERSKRTYNRS